MPSTSPSSTPTDSSPDPRPSPTPLPSCWPSSDGPAPIYATARTDRPTLGPGVAKLAEVIGRPFMPWQRYVADVALELDDDGRFVYRQVVVTIPRHSGKTTCCGMVMEHRAMLLRGGR